MRRFNTRLVSRAAGFVAVSLGIFTISCTSPTPTPSPPSAEPASDDPLEKEIAAVVSAFSETIRLGSYAEAMRIFPEEIRTAVAGMEEAFFAPILPGEGCGFEVFLLGVSSMESIHRVGIRMTYPACPDQPELAWAWDMVRQDRGWVVVAFSDPQPIQEYDRLPKGL